MSKLKKQQNPLKAYVNERLDKVTELLNDIAEHTGREYVVLHGELIGLMIKAGNSLATGLTETVKVLNTRRKLANKFRENKNDNR